MNKSKIFFSHAHEDADNAKIIQEWIDEILLGAIDFFISTDKISIPIGSNWFDKLTSALNDSIIFFTLITPISINKNWIFFESGAGFIRGLPVIPICIGGLNIKDLKPPLSFLQSIQLPDEKNERQLLELVAKSAGLRTPKIFDRIILPEYKMLETKIITESKDINILEKKPNLNTVNRRELFSILNIFDKEELYKLKAIINEALFISEMSKWSGNESDPEVAISKVKSRFKKRVILKDADFDLMLKEAEEIKNNYYKVKEQELKKDSLSGYDWVRKVLVPIFERLPSLDEYEEKITEYSPELYVPLLIKERKDDRYSVAKNNFIDNILLNNGYGELLLPELASIITSNRFESWEFKDAIKLSRKILGDAFESWYKGQRGLNYFEDLKEFEKLENEKELLRKKEYILEMERAKNKK